VEDQTDRQDLGQPRIATLRVGGAPDDDPSDGEQDHRYMRRAAIGWGVGGCPLGIRTCRSSPSDLARRVLDHGQLVERRRRGGIGGPEDWYLFRLVAIVARLLVGRLEL
jgi:hypothetical protein